MKTPAGVWYIAINMGNYISSYRLDNAIDSGDVKTVEKIARSNFNVQANANYFLRKACEKGNLDIVKILVLSGADVCSYGNLPLCIASDYGYLDIVKYLVSVGAKAGFETLNIAARHGRLNVVQYFISECGLDPSLAKQVAQQLMAYDALGAHARDELGISKTVSARPVQAALASAASFATGAALPLLVTAMAPATALIPLVAGTSLAFLALLGGLAAHTGGAGVTAGALRVTFWGALAMAVTAGVGVLFKT